MILKNIQQLCADRGISILSLERAVGLGNGTIGKWGSSSPRVDGLRRVADYFGVTVDDLLGQDAGRSPPDGCAGQRVGSA